MGVLAGGVTSTPLHGLSPAQIAERVRASRLTQGLPERVTDVRVLRDVAALLGGSVRVLAAGRCGPPRVA